IAAMTPASNLGAASPVSIGLPGSGPDDQAEDQGNGDGAKTEGKQKKSNTDTMSSKVTNEAAAHVRSLAELRGRTADRAEQAVLEAHSMSAREALEAKVIDVLAGNTAQLLEQLDGRAVELDSGASVTLNTAQATIERIEPGWRTQVLALLANPQVALILMM